MRGKVVTGINADSRFCLIAAVVERAGLHPAQGTVRVVSPLQRRRWSRPTGQPRLRTSSIPGHRPREGERLSGSGWAAGSGVVAFTVDPCPRGRGCVGHCGLEGSGWWHRYSIGKGLSDWRWTGGSPVRRRPRTATGSMPPRELPSRGGPGHVSGRRVAPRVHSNGIAGISPATRRPSSLSRIARDAGSDPCGRRGHSLERHDAPARHEGASQVDQSRTTAVTPAGTGRARGQRHPRHARAHPVGQAPSGSTGLPMTRPWTARSS